MKPVRVAALALILLATAGAPATAQQCDPGHNGWTARVLSGVRSGDHGSSASWTMSAALEYAPSARLGVHARYVHHHGGGQAARLQTVAAGATFAPSLPFAPCIGVAAYLSAARNTAGSDYYLSLAIPLALGRGVSAKAGDARLYFFAAGMLVYAANDARLYSFDLAHTAFGWGGAARAEIGFGRLSIALDLRSVQLPAAVRPNGLGVHTAELSTGLRF